VKSCAAAIFEPTKPVYPIRAVLTVVLRSELMAGCLTAAGPVACPS
jgi:hypothetical protein